jgi:hypothetical protein
VVQKFTPELLDVELSSSKKTEKQAESGAVPMVKMSPPDIGVLFSGLATQSWVISENIETAEKH